MIYGSGEFGGWSWVLIPPELNYKTQTAQKSVKIVGW